jgi:hypothetical protein
VKVPLEEPLYLPDQVPDSPSDATAVDGAAAEEAGRGVVATVTVADLEGTLVLVTVGLLSLLQPSAMAESPDKTAANSSLLNGERYRDIRLPPEFLG